VDIGQDDFVDDLLDGLFLSPVGQVGAEGDALSEDLVADLATHRLEFFRPSTGRSSVAKASRVGSVAWTKPGKS